jgi:hypothetical protein
MLGRFAFASVARTKLKPSLNSTGIANPIVVLLAGKERCIVLRFEQYETGPPEVFPAF